MHDPCTASHRKSGARAWPCVRIYSTAPAPAQRLLALACIACLSFYGCSASRKSDGAGPGDDEPADTTSAGSASTKKDGGTHSPSSTTKAPTSGGKPASGPAAQAPEVTPATAITSEPITIDDCGDNNAAGLSPADLQKLKAGGGSPDALKWLYPYDGTVLPRGMLAPDLMWNGPAADAVYVHIKSKIFEYSGCLKPTEEGRIALAQDLWEKAGQRSGGHQDLYTVELSVLSQGKVTGPVTSHLQIAQAAIKGSIYYNTYSSRLMAGGGAAAADPGGIGGIGGLPGGGFPGGGFPGGGGSGGVVVRIPPGGRAEVFGQVDCNGCHSVSADGSRLLAQSVAGGAYSYDLSVIGPAPMPAMAGSNGAWTALYPDGSAFLTMSTVIDVARAQVFGGVIGGLNGSTASADAALYDAKTGKPIASTGIPKGALMPFFSPDGAFLVFNDYAIDEAHGIALMKYDTATHTATDYGVLYKEAAGAMRPAWPFVLPDNHGVVFVRTEDGDFTGGGVGVSGGLMPGGGAAAPFSELSIIDVDSKTVTVLAKAMGYNAPEDAAKNTTYLPFGADDLHHSYYPTVSPVASGGYFWVFFDSIRNYGRLGLQRQLWGAAIDIAADGTYTADPSHPAFYVSGQEAGTGNHRAFAALDACHKDGDSCSSGIDCCGGFCYAPAGPLGGEFVEPVGTCSPKMAECSQRDERCLNDADCCAPKGNEAPNSCIAGFCAYIQVL